MGLAFPTRPNQELLVAIPLVAPIGWKSSPPVSSMGTETIVDLANSRLRTPSYLPPPHHLDNLAEKIAPARMRDPTPWPSTPIAVNLPVKWDLSLPTMGKPLQYNNIFVDDFISLAQRPFLRGSVTLYYRPSIRSSVHWTSRTDPNVESQSPSRN